MMTAKSVKNDRSVPCGGAFAAEAAMGINATCNIEKRGRMWTLDDPYNLYVQLSRGTIRM
jgi:hypothetical protein